VAGGEGCCVLVDGGWDEDDVVVPGFNRWEGGARFVSGGVEDYVVEFVEGDEVEFVDPGVNRWVWGTRFVRGCWDEEGVEEDGVCVDVDVEEGGVVDGL
jgi:hypothetical protein